MATQKLTGKIFGTLTVLNHHHRTIGNHTDHWLCVCSGCGEERVVSTGMLTSCKFKQCCYPGVIVSDLTGLRVGRLTVTGLNRKQWRRDVRYWHTVCDCGQKESIAEGNLISTKHARFQCTKCSRTEVAKITHRYDESENIQRDTTEQLREYLKHNPHYLSPSVDMRSSDGIINLWGTVIREAHQDGEDYEWICKMVGVDTAIIAEGFGE